MNVLDLLKKDHQAVLELFDKICEKEKNKSLLKLVMTKKKIPQIGYLSHMLSLKHVTTSTLPLR